MKKITGKIATLDSVLTGSSLFKHEVLTEATFKSAIENKEFNMDLRANINGESVSIGLIQQFWVDEEDGVKYLFCRGVLFDEYDLDSTPFLRTFSIIDDSEENSH
jgi:hypothetical protein